MSPKLINTKEAAAILGVKKNTMEGWRLRGEGPRFRKIGSLVKYTENDINAYIDAQTRQSTSQTGPVITQ